MVVFNGKENGVPFGFATGNIGVAILLTLLPGLLGFYIGWLNEKRFSGSIVPGWMLHGIINTLAAAVSL